MRVRCPNCHDSTEVDDSTELSAITCSACGSSFSLVGEQTLPYTSGESKTIGHFELLDKIGVGAFGSVWMARDTQLDRTVAIKIPRKGQLDPQESEQFLREARAAAQLQHPNIVAVHEVGREDGQVYIVSDYVEGLTLADWLVGQQLTSRAAAELCLKVAEALHHAHEQGVIHRDLKPTNIILDRDNEPHIMDFGLARREAGEVTMTMEGKVLGTPAYMSPEQAKGEAHNADRRSDVYSLGVVLYELLTGHKPFRGNVRMLLKQVIEDDAPSPRKLNSSIPRDMETLCLRCLEKDPGKRYNSAHELAAELHRYLEGEPILARPIGVPDRAWRWSKRNRVLAASMATTAVVLFAATLGSIVAARYFADQKTIAESERAAANKERQEAVRLERLATTRAKQLERQIYLIHLANADTALLDNDYRSGQTELDACPVDQRGWEWHFLDRRIDATVPRAFAGGEQPSFSRDGSLLIAVGAAGTPQHRMGQIWRLSSGKIERSVQHDSAISSLAVSPDEKLIVGGDYSGNLFLWDIVSGEKLWSVKENSNKFDGLAFNPEGTLIAAANQDMTLNVFDAADGNLAFSIPFRSRRRKVTFSPSGKWIASGSFKRLVSSSTVLRATLERRG